MPIIPKKLINLDDTPAGYSNTKYLKSLGGSTEWDTPGGGGSGAGYVPRNADNPGYDYSQGDFTWDATWRDLDLSGILPVGASAVVMRVYIRDDTASMYFGFRRNGNTNDREAGYARTQVANVGVEYVFIIPVDANRVVEYKGSNATVDTMVIYVMGWFA